MGSISMVAALFCYHTDMTTYTKLVKKAAYTKRNLFTVTYNFSHGDADSTSTQEEDYAMTDDQMIAFVNEFNRYAKVISDYNSGYSSDAPDTELEFGGHSLPFEWDVIHQDNLAVPSIDEIIYHDDSGNRMRVQMQ